MSYSNDLYNVKKYTDKELLDILNLSNPTDRELEAKILHMIWKYENMDNVSSDKFVQFFKDIYDHFFEVEEDNDANSETEEEYNKEGFSNINTKISSSSNVSKPISTLQKTLPTDEINQVRQMQYAFPVEYSKDYLNPLLKQTIKRNVVIDSQYRESKNYNSPTNFTFNLSEPLKDVVSLKLYSFQIPYTWYTINNNYGSNFFYLKGNAPGIDTGGNKDIKIEIPVGNYSSGELVSTVNKNMSQSFQTTYSDISFGATSINYTYANSKTTLSIDITNNYNEIYYQIRFADPNLSSFLGYKNTVYSPTKITSNVIFDYNNEDYLLTTKNNYFKIINYVNSVIPPENDYYDNSANSIILNSITITLSLPSSSSGIKYTRIQLFDDLKLQIQNTKELMNNYSSINFVSSNNGNFFELNLKTDRHYMSTTQNSKKVVVFPRDTTINDHDIWIDNNIGQSAFSFIDPFTDKIYSNDNNNYYIELSNIISEGTIVNNQVYDLGGLNRKIYLDLLSNNPKLNNNINFKIVKDLTIISPSIYYSIDEYLTAINVDLKNNTNYYDNSGIKQINNINILSNTGIYKNDDSHSTLNLQFLNKVIDQSNYLIKLYKGTCFTNHINITTPLNTDNSGNYIIIPGTILNYQINAEPNGYTLINNEKIMTITNDQTNFHTSKNCENIDINYSNTNNSNLQIYALNDYINEITSKIFNGIYKDPDTTTENNILNGSIYTPIINQNSLQIGTIQFNINRFVTQNDYNLFFVDTFADMQQYNGSDCFDDPENSWGYYLKYYSGTDVFRNNINPYPYVLKNKVNKDIMGSYASIIGEQPTIDIYFNLNSDPSLNHIYIEPLSDANGGDGLYVNDNIIDIDLNNNSESSTSIGYYNLLGIITKYINNFNVSKNTTFSTTTESGYIKTKLRLNINKTYTSDDYILAFYDPFYFTTCVFNRNIQNTTWDATLGWILGYRKNTQYVLSDYIISGSNIVTITGDTVVNVNLYNYFMIVLDDYNQNHLNDGLVTTSKRETNISLPSYTNKAMFKCDTNGNQTTSTVASTGDNNLTQKQIYAAQEIINTNSSTYQETGTTQINKNYFSSGPFTNDLFAVIPLKVSGIQNNGTYVDYGGSLQNQERVYFGPVNINRMNIKLINDRGEIVDLNNTDWSFSLICEQLYQQKKL